MRMKRMMRQMVLDEIVKRVRADFPMLASKWVCLLDDIALVKVSVESLAAVDVDVDVDVHVHVHVHIGVGVADKSQLVTWKV